MTAMQISRNCSIDGYLHHASAVTRRPHQGAIGSKYV
jgi:hypothetical protein